MSLQEVLSTKYRVTPAKSKRVKATYSAKYLKYKAVLEQDFQMRLTSRFHIRGKYRVSFKTPIPLDPMLAMPYFTNDLEDAYAEGKFRRVQETWRTINSILMAEAKACGREFSEY